MISMILLYKYESNLPVINYSSIHYIYIIYINSTYHYPLPLPYPANDVYTICRHTPAYTQYTYCTTVYTAYTAY